MSLKRFYDPPRATLDTKSKDPIKAAVLQAIVSCEGRLHYDYHFRWDIVEALAQTNGVFPSLHSSDLKKVH